MSQHKDLFKKMVELEEAEKAFELYSENIKKTLETKSIIK